MDAVDVVTALLADDRVSKFAPWVQIHVKIKPALRESLRLGRGGG